MTRLAATLAAGAFALLAAAPARAQLDAAAVAQVTGGATTNPLLAVDDSPAVGFDEFTIVRAGLRARYVGPRAEQRLGYSYTGTFYASHTEANGQAHELAWTLHARPSGRTDLDARVAGTYGFLNSINPLAAAGALSVQTVAGVGFTAIPTGSVTYFGSDANAKGTYRPDGVTTFSELTDVLTFVPISGDAPRSIAVLQSGHFERAWGRNSLTADASVSYLDATAYALDAGAFPFPATRTFQAQALAGWRHDFSPALYLSASAGVLFIDATVFNQLSVQPVGVVTLHHQTDAALLELVVTQTPQLNVYVGQSLLIDGAFGRAAFPLDRLQRFHLVGAGTAQRAWAIESGLEPATDLVAADVGLAFTPVLHPFVASLDYALQDQIGHTAGTVPYPSLHRQMVMLSISGTWGTDPTMR
jgi:YD repeat-containing protein